MTVVVCVDPAWFTQVSCTWSPGLWEWRAVPKSAADAIGLPPWANFFVSFIAATLTRTALSPLLPRRRAWTRVQWRRIDLDELLP